ncbi:MAG TPA: HAD family acid phosphatase [Candidatus Wallbacteria bacterium]|nr:HAD family acid phosphatase [Candidatus Wallbacteria bacterium]
MKLFTVSLVVLTLLLSLGVNLAVAAVTSDGSAPVYKPELLGETLKACEKAVAEKQLPVVVFDLDSTLFDNAPRNRAIIEEFAETVKDKYPDFYKAVKAMKNENLAYSLDDTLKNIGISDDKILKELKKVWYDKFFTDKYVVLDKAYEGAVDYVTKLHKAGAKIVYLTGRDTPDMEKGTLQSLKDYKFPIGDTNSVLLTKPEKKIKDDEYKKTASAEIMKMGKVVASFDNEPKNVNLFKEVFPGAIIVFVETNHSPKAVPVNASIPWIKSWK